MLGLTRISGLWGHAWDTGEVRAASLLIHPIATSNVIKPNGMHNGGEVRNPPSTIFQNRTSAYRLVRRTKAYIKIKGRLWPVGQAFFAERLAIRPRGADGQYGFYLGAHEVASIDLTKPTPVSHVSEQGSDMSPH